MLGGASVLAAVLAVVVAMGVLLSGEASTSTAQPASANTGTVQRGRLSAVISQAGTLTYRARPDGSPFAALNQATGTYTRLPEVGDRIACGRELYRVDDEPVLLLCGRLPAYRTLRKGDTGQDVHQLNRALHVRGASDVFTAGTERALTSLQHRRGMDVTGALALGDVVVLPTSARIADVTGQLGGPAQPGTRALTATSSTLQVVVDLTPTEQGQVQRGARALITLPGTKAVLGTVIAFGRTAEVPVQQGSGPVDATIPTSIRLDNPSQARGLDGAPVQVEVTTRAISDALSVPVTALVGRAGGGYGVEVLRPDGRRDLIAVQPGLFDDAHGRAQVVGPLHAGDHVTVPSL